MTGREPARAAEAIALKEILDRFPSLDALKGSPDWGMVEARLAGLLETRRRHAPATPPAPARDPSRLHVVHWNIEHGNQYEAVERALCSHPDLAGADLVMLNEVDLGMARAGNRDVTGDLAQALGFHGAWAPLFLETTPGRDDDPRQAAGRPNEEAMFGLALLSRWPIAGLWGVRLPSPQRLQFDLERMYGWHIALVAEIERPGSPFIAVSTHLEVHRTRAHRAAQMRFLMEALEHERRPVILAGDFNSHTFDRGLWHSPLSGGVSLLTWPGPLLRERLLHPERGFLHEPLFDALRAGGFAWERWVDFAPTLGLRMDRLDEVHALPAWLRRPAEALGVFGWAERRARLRLDWFAARGFEHGEGRTVTGLDGPGLASDHAPIAAWFA